MRVLWRKMKCRELEQITLSRKAWKKQPKNQRVYKVVGLDTETVNGKCFLISIFIEGKGIVRRIKNFDDLVIIFKEYNLDDTMNFFYNLTFDTNAMIKHLPHNKLRSLAFLDRATYKDYIIEIVPNKQLMIQYKKRKFIFYDLAQFYNHESLNEVAKRIIGENKEDFDVKQLSTSRYDHNKEYRAELDKYIIQDSRLCQLIGQNLYDISRKFLNPKYFYSQASLAQQYCLENLKRDYKLPSKDILQYALYAYNGGRFEVFKRGTYDNVSCYDIKSAYPDETIKIPAMDKGKWVQNDKYESKSLISLFKGKVTGHSHISPMRDEKDGLLYYPTGSKIMYFNKQEYEVFRLYGYDVEVFNAYHYFDDNPEYPFLFLKKFFDEKERVGENHPEYMFYKINLNGFYGKTIQLEPEKYVSDDQKDAIDMFIEKGTIRFVKARHKAGLLFNPIIAQEITANTRCKLLRAVHKTQQDIIAFATDSIITTSKPDIIIGNNLGEWTVKDSEHNKTFTSIGCGVYFFHSKNKMKFRGYGKTYNPKDVFSAKTGKIIKIPTTKVIKLKQSVRQKTVKTVDGEIDLGIDDLNRFLTVEKELSLNFDKKRDWEGEFEEVGDIYTKRIESKPIVITKI